jgi:hypothetical protein
MLDPVYRQHISEGTIRGQALMSAYDKELWSRNKGLAKRGTVASQDTCDKLAKVAPHNFRGGSTADAYALILCPVGFIREYHFTYGVPSVATNGVGLRRPRYQMDFVHLEGKINIELDGLRHKASAEHDNRRDAILREHGWKVIRIRETEKRRT